MIDRSARGDLSTEDLATLLEVTRSLAAPFDLMTMLAAVTAAARQVLRAERARSGCTTRPPASWCSRSSSDIRARAHSGRRSASSARARAIARCINVPDCYADPRFDPASRSRDRATAPAAC